MTEKYVNDKNLDKINETLSSLFTNNDANNVKTTASITEMFANPNAIMEKIQENCASMQNLMEISASMLGDEEVTAQVGADDEGNPINETFNTGFEGIDPMAISQNMLNQTQDIINESCTMVADKLKTVNKLTSLLEGVKSAMSSGDVDKIQKVQKEITSALNDVNTGDITKSEK